MGGADSPPSRRTRRPGSDFTAVAADRTYSGDLAVALRADGTLAAWGTDFYGSVSTAPTGAGFIAVAAGNATGAAIQVPPGLEELDTLGDAVQALVDDGILPERQGASLSRTLTKAEADLAKDRIQAVIRRVERFVAHVERLVSQGKLSRAADGQDLIDVATTLLDHLAA